jgi:hypothetical protein
VGPGVHLLDVQSNHLLFSQVKVQLLNDAMDDPKFVEYPYAGAAKFPLTKLILTAHASYEFFQPKPGFSPFAMLKNPMFLMMIVSVGLMFVMPKMMEGLDPEQQEQMRQQMKNQQDPSKMLSQMFSGAEETPAKKISSSKKTRRTKRE